MKFNCGGALTALSEGWDKRCLFSPTEILHPVFASIGWTCNPGLERPVSAHLRTETKGRNGKKGTKGQTVWAGCIPGTPISLDYCPRKVWVWSFPPSCSREALSILSTSDSSGFELCWLSKDQCEPSSHPEPRLGLNWAESWHWGVVNLVSSWKWSPHSLLSVSSNSEGKL